MIRLRTLTIHKFRNVAAGTTLAFGRQTILLGKNGTGKTTLLRIVSMCLSSNISEIEEDFDLEFQVDFESDTAALSINVRAKKAKQLTPQLDGNLIAESSDKLSAELSFSLDGKNYVVSMEGPYTKVECDEQQVVAQIAQNPDELFPLFRALLLVDNKVESEILNAMTLATFAMSRGLYRYDESLEVFDEILNDVEYVLFQQEEGTTRRMWHLVPHSVMKAIDECTSFGNTASSISIPSDDLRFLSTFVQTIGFKGATLDIQLLRKDVGRKILEYGNFRFSFELSDGGIISHKELSYGQKRLLAFYYYLECNQHCIIADELVNGLHHGWIEQAMQQIGDQRQAFLSSQNPLLLDCLTFESPKDAKHTFVICDLDDEHLMRWRNLSDSEADSFYKAYESGFQHVGEILHSKGLW